MVDFKLKKSCADCPFMVRDHRRELVSDTAGVILRGLIRREPFVCHKTTHSNMARVPRDAIEYNEQHCFGALVMIVRGCAPMTPEIQLAMDSGSIRVDMFDGVETWKSPESWYREKNSIVESFHFYARNPGVRRV